MTWDNVKKIDSSEGTVAKYVFEKSDAVAEAVLYKYPTYSERTVICCSTQSGCPVGCRFCGAGDSFVRSLTTEEIVSQPDLLIKDTGIPAEDIDSIGRLQIMFMSMGEPMLNLKALVPALHDLYVKYPIAALLISSIGPNVDYGPFIEVSKQIPTIGLQFSVHESFDEPRNALIPFKAKMTLEQIAAKGLEWSKATGRRPFFNYCAHDGNNSEEDAQRLQDLFPPSVWEATVSVVCERDEDVAAANARQRKLAEDFMYELRCKGFSTRTFDPAGQDDIGGGCGQLWFVQKWMKDNPKLAKKSVGRGLPVIHTPR
jgi:23S rRNA (adenine2503-C2)-methyltransferase